jgi:hypothetical protein
MHLLGKSFVAFAVKPQGDTIPLIRINNWDFRWQYFYTFPKMVHIPAGSTIEVIAVMDNTENKSQQSPFIHLNRWREEKGACELPMRCCSSLLLFSRINPVMKIFPLQASVNMQ